jgi:hypothetical protein
MFVYAVTQERIFEPERMEQIRRRLLAWLSEKYPRLVLEQFNAEACIGCAIEKAHIDTGDMRDAIRIMVRAGLP